MHLWCFIIHCFSSSSRLAKCSACQQPCTAAEIIEVDIPVHACINIVIPIDSHLLERLAGELQVLFGHTQYLTSKITVIARTRVIYWPFLESYMLHTTVYISLALQQY